MDLMSQKSDDSGRLRDGVSRWKNISETDLSVRRRVGEGLSGRRTRIGFLCREKGVFSRAYISRTSPDPANHNTPRIPESLRHRHLSRCLPARVSGRDTRWVPIRSLLHGFIQGPGGRMSLDTHED